MLEITKQILLAIAGIPSLIILVLAALAKLRDELVNLGWVPEHGRIGKMMNRAQRAQIQRVLREIGFTSDHFRALRHAVDDAAAHLDGPNVRLHTILLTNLKEWTKELEPGFLFNNQRYYVDTMGAMDYVHDESIMARITVQWIQLLRNHGVPRPDLLLTMKDGNVALVRQVCRILSPSGAVKPIVCKGMRDHSRVIGTEGAIHISDFEGLEPFRASDDFCEMLPGTTLQVIACDDNCTSGATLCSAIERFNRYIKEKNLPFEPVRHAVVLFAVKHNDAESSFHRANATLHALLSLGPEEMQRIRSATSEELARNAADFQQGFACENARRIWGESV